MIKSSIYGIILLAFQAYNSVRTHSQNIQSLFNFL